MAAPGATAGDRIAALDLIRGVAVLGILAVNIAGFAGPTLGVFSPDAMRSGTPLDHGVFVAMLIVFEGKMRALFGVLFGASLVLFVDRAEAAGRDGQTLQMRRLGWLAVFGYCHFLLWWGDILFPYAIAGFTALALRQMPGRALLTLALLIFSAWQINGIVEDLPGALIERQVAAGTATPAQVASDTADRVTRSVWVANELRTLRGGFGAQVRAKLERPFEPLQSSLITIGETLPYMLIGMLLVRAGFFSGGWTRFRLIATALAGIGLGGTVTVLFVAWAARHGFPILAMQLVINAGLALPHLAMALGYAAVVVLATPRLLATAPGRRIAAAGRMAFSNYIGTTLLMTGLFYGWGLGLIGTVPPAGQASFVLLGWVLMLGWSAPWLARFGQGPLERLWRTLTDMRVVKN